MTVDTPTRTPLLSLVLGYGPMASILVVAVAVWLRVSFALALGQVLAAALLLFFAGVVRGLSFFTEGGPRFGQVVMTLVRFGLGFLALIAPPFIAFVLLAIGYALVAVYDRQSAQTGGAPRYFASLRPHQMLIALVGIGTMLIYAVAA